MYAAHFSIYRPRTPIRICSQGGRKSTSSLKEDCILKESSTLDSLDGYETLQIHEIFILLSATLGQEGDYKSLLYQVRLSWLENHEAS